MMLYEIDSIYQKAIKLYDNGEIFRSYMRHDEIFPYTVSLKKPTQKEVRANLTTLVDEMQALERLHLMVEYKEFDFKSIGTQRLPVSVVFERREDFLRFIKKEEEFRNFTQAYGQAVQRFADVKQLFLTKPKILLQSMAIIEPLLDVVDFFVHHPCPNIYVRELSIEGVDTKFIQKNKVLLDTLLSALLDKQSFNSSITKLSENGFERKYGLKYELPLVRFRILDEKLYINGLSDISLTTEEFKALKIECENVFIVENKITMLSFPPLRDAIVIFGAGYGVGRVREVAWMREKKIFYWGDIDMDGFAILSQARGYFSQLQSIFMDTNTLEKFLDLAISSQDKSYKTLAHLTQAEILVYERLFQDYYGKNVRLEQERIPFSYIKKELNAFR